MKKVLLSMMGLWVGMCLSAQTAVTLPYEFGFEDAESAELANWVLNPGHNAADQVNDQWMVGTALHSDGQKGLYISSDGATAVCGNTGSQQIVQFVYRDFTFTDNGQYYISFDYLCPNMKLYAGYVQFVTGPGQNPTRQNLVTEQLGTEQMPNIGTPRVSITGGAGTWHNANYTLNVTNAAAPNQTTYRVYFAWANNVADSVQAGISAAIDNVQILRAGCPKPQFFEGEVLDCDNVNFSWEGSSARYQIQYRTVGESNWRNRMVNNAEKNYRFNGMKEGNYDFRVRGICYEEQADGSFDTIYSPYVYLSNFNVFCPELHCIRYADITDTTVARCTYGGNYDGYNRNPEVAFATEGVIDFGWNSENSRHTVVWDTTAYDPNTNGALRMVPSGEVASVRLGNWKTGAEAEAITYTYNVDNSNSIILIKYAIVVEDPDHSPDEQPRFVIQIRDEKGELIDPTCGVVDLNPSSNRDAFQLVSGTSGYSTVRFKDWTMLGLNLDQYMGQTIQISVATYDCSQSGHYGYAYFTMDCTSASIKNTSCGAQSSMKVIAPVGFYYDWHPAGTARTRSTEREIEILATDPTDWVCTLTSTENPGCSFDLTINTTARFPQAEFSLERDNSANCENRYAIANTSYIWTNKDGVREDHRDEVCDEFEWDFGMGDEGITSEANPGYFVFPEEGGTYTIKLAAMIGLGEGSCRSEVEQTITVPAIGETRLRDTAVICEGSYYEFHGKRYSEAGDYGFNGRNEYGCISFDSLHLVLNPKSTTILGDTTICYGDSVSYAGYTRRTTGDLVATVPNIFGCDSSIVQHVVVLDEIHYDVTAHEIDEEHEYASIYVTLPDDGSCTSFVYEGKTYTASTELTGLEGGDYDLEFYNDFGCVVYRTVSLKAGCLRNMIYPRWDDVLSLKNSEYRDKRYKDLVFTGYQWFKDNMPIQGAVKSYYFEPGGLTPGVEYSCDITLQDGTIAQACAYVPQAVARVVEVTPTLLTDGATLTISVPEDCYFSVYSTSGLKMMSAPLAEGDNYLQVSLEPGMYILQVCLDGMERPYRLTVAK